jgi:uncharacterized protein (TIRG00374 family)
VRDAFRRHDGLVLRVVASVVLLGAVLAYADVGDVARALRDASWGWFVAAVALMTVATVVGAVRWRILLEGAEIGVSAPAATRAFAASLFLNNVLPTSVGGDAVRAWLVGRASGRLVRAATATVVDKATALACLVGVAWIAVLADSGAVPRSLVVALAWVTLGLTLAAILAALVATGVRPLLRRLPERFASIAREGWITLRLSARSPRVLWALVVLGLAYQALAVGVLVLLGKTLGLELSFPLMAVSAAIVLLAMLAPISIGGLGVREGGFVLLLGEAGVSAAEATSLSLLSAVTILVASGAVVVATAGYDRLQLRGDPRPSAQ